MTGYVAVRQGAHKIFGNNLIMNTGQEDRKRAAIEKQIDENLRRVYEQDTPQQIPDKFLQLLDKLRQQE